jgi:hypothetical protein
MRTRLLAVGLALTGIIAAIAALAVAVSLRQRAVVRPGFAAMTTSVSDETAGSIAATPSPEPVATGSGPPRRTPPP